ncbi:MAG: cytochrome c oxidase subunit II [Chloroflexi bacterium]|nr:cytochrome c oxidase subunit II [Chloroflexota bacterium]
MAVRIRSPLRWVPLALLLAATAVLSGCLGMGEGPQTTIVPFSDHAQRIQDLYVLVFWMAAGVFVVVEAALVYATLRYRRRPDDVLPPQVHGNTRLEVAWTIAPAVVLFVIAIPTIQAIFAAATPPGSDGLEIVVTGHQWWWELEYPDAQVVTANEVHIPVGRPISFTLKSADVIHSFWVPRLGGKMDVVPGHTNHLYLTAYQAGTYLGQCVEFCGLQHANMKLRLIAHTPEEFDAWVQSQQAPPSQAAGKAQEGAQVFARSACVGCHTVAGTPAQGKIGPNLTHVGSRTSLAGAVLDNTPENLARWLRDPQEVKPGNQMPNLHLSDVDIEALVAYLESLK